MTRHLVSRSCADCHGFGTLEAVIALLIASLGLTALTVVSSNALDRARRAEMMFQEALALERLSACVPRIPRRSMLKVDMVPPEPHPCLSVHSSLELMPGSGVLRGVRSREVPVATLLVLDLESQEP
jgi:hypothetical protein